MVVLDKSWSAAMVKATKGNGQGQRVAVAELRLGSSSLDGNHDAADLFLPGGARRNRYRQQQDLSRLAAHFKHWVFVCTRMNAQSVSSQRLRLYLGRARGAEAAVRSFKGRLSGVHPQKQRDLMIRASTGRAAGNAEVIDEITEHPILDLFAAVNEYENRFGVFQLRETYLSLTGSAYWYVASNALGLPVKLYTMPALWVSPIPGEDRFIDHYDFGTWGQMERFETDEVVRFTSPNPLDMLYGYPDLAAVIEESKLYDDIRAFDLNMLRNQGVPSIFVGLDENQDPDLVVKTINDIQERLAGPRNAGAIYAARGVKSVTPLIVRLRDLNHPEGRRWIKEVIAAAWGVPMSLLGVDDVNRANAEAGQRQYARYTIKPKLTQCEEALNQDLIPRWGDPRLFVAFDDPVPEDRELRMREREAYIRTGSPINEQNAIDGLAQVEGGDVSLVSNQLVPLSTMGSAAASTDAGKAAIKAGSRGELKRLVEHVENPPFERALRVVFNSMRDDVLSRMKAKSKHAEPRRTKETPDVPGTAELPVYTFDDVRFWVYDAGAWQQVMAEKGVPFIETAMFRGAEVGLRELPEDIGGAFNVRNPLLQEAIAKRSADAAHGFADSAVNTNRDGLFNTLRQGIDEGESIPKLRDRVQDMFDTLSKRQAETIARSETIRASNGGALEVYRLTGVERMEWLAAADACEMCSAMTGTVVSVNDPFLKDGEFFRGTLGGMMQANYGAVWTPPLHPSCRCTIIPVI